MINQNKLNLSKMRNLTQLKKSGMDLSSTSNEVAKLWDSILFQLYCHFDAPEIDGIQGSINSIQTIDPEFPLIKLFTLDISCENYEFKLNDVKVELKNQFESHNLGRKWTAYEKLHVKAFIYKLEGYDNLAAEIWLDQLVQYPQDLLALIYLNDHFIGTGTTQEIPHPFNLCRREMSTQDVYYPLILSYEAFGLQEQGHLNQALNMANESLNIYPWNSWATHTVAHVFYSNGNSKNGLEFMNRTKPDWIDNTMLACHNIWHIGLLHLNQGDTNAALDILDTEILPRLNSGYSHFNMSDAVSLLMRIELAHTYWPISKLDVNLTDRWIDLSTSIGKKVESFSICEFYDAHLALAMMGCNKPKILDQMLDRCNDWTMKFENRIFDEWECNPFVKMFQAKQIPSDRFVTKSQRMIPFIEALKFFTNGDYQATINLLYPIRKELRKLGGSNAQNDIFYQLLASALLNAGGNENLARLKMLILDRKDFHEYNGYYERIERSILDFH